MAANDLLPKVNSTHYDDFNLEIGIGSGRAYPVRVRSSAGTISTTLHFPFDELALENRLQTLQIALLRSGGTRRRIVSPIEESVQEFGQALFDALFSSDVRSLYDVSQRTASQAGNGLRITLAIQSPELAALPWEFLYDPRRGEYTALARSTPVMRTLDLPQPLEALTVNSPLRILAMVAAPTDLQELDMPREKERVERAISSLHARGLLELVWVEGQTWRDLQRAMRSGPWHIFHFIGHGGFDPVADEGMIALADEGGHTALLNATQLGRLLADHRSLRLVLLNACASAQSSDRDIFSSTAAILVRRNIPAVLAMQYEISDRAAIEFAQAFYEALADGFTISAAVAEARIAMSLAVANSVEWGTPVLYMRGADGVLFAVQASSRIATDAPGGRPATLSVTTQTNSQARTIETAPISPTPGLKRLWNSGKVFKFGLVLLVLAIVAGLVWYVVGPLSLPATTPPVSTQTVAAPSTSLATVSATLRATATPLATAVALPTTPTAQLPILLRDGEIALNYGNYDLALAKFQAVLATDPRNVGGLVGKGRAHEGLKQIEAALLSYQQALQVTPDSAEANFRLGYLEFNAFNDYSAALTHLTRAIEYSAPDRLVSYYFARAQVFLAIPQYDEALADVTEAIRRNPSSDMYLYRAEIYRDKGDWNAAEKDFTNAVNQSPDAPKYYYYRALFYDRYKNQIEAAVADYQKYILLEDRTQYPKLVAEAERFIAQHTTATPALPTPPSATGLSTLLYTSLDSVAAIEQPVIGIGGETTLQELDFVAGKNGNGVQFSAGQQKYITFPLAQDNQRNVNFAQGEVEFWYKPNYAAGADNQERKLFLIGVPGGSHNIVFYIDGESLILLVNTPGPVFQDLVSATKWHAPLWNAGEWVQIRAVWNSANATDALQIYVNDEQVDERNVAGGWNLPPGSDDQIFIGAADNTGDSNADGVIDELVIRSPSAVITAANVPQITEVTRLGKGSLNDLALSANGQTLAVASSFGAYVYDATTFTLTQSMPTVSEVKRVAVSKNGQILAASEYNSIRLWRVADNLLLDSFEGPGGITDLEFSPNDKWLATGYQDGSVRLWNVATRALFFTAQQHADSIYDVAFSPDSAHMATASADKTVRLWGIDDTDKLTVTHTFDQFSGAVFSLVFSPNSKWLATAGSENKIDFWNVADGKLVRTLEEDLGFVDKVAFSPDSTLFVAGTEHKEVRVWDTATWTQRAIVKDFYGAVFDLAFSPNGQTLITGSTDAMIRMFETRAWRPVHSRDEFMPASQRKIVFSGDGKWLVATAVNTVYLWQMPALAQRSPLIETEGGVVDIAIAPADAVLASVAGWGRVRLWAMESAALLRTLPVDSASCIAIAPDGKTVAIGQADGTIRLLRASDGAELRSFQEHALAVRTLIFSHDGQLLASGSDDKTVAIWQVSAGVVLHKFTQNQAIVNSVAFSPDGQLVASGAQDGTILLWQVSDGTLVDTIGERQYPVHSITFSPSSELLAVGSGDHLIHFWRAADRTKLGELTGHRCEVMSVTFSPDGARLASSSCDGTVRLWGVR